MTSDSQPGDSQPVSGPGGPGARVRKPIALNQLELVRETLFDSNPLPLVYQPVVEGLSLPHWAGANFKQIRARLLTAGAILFRGFKISSTEEFQEFLTSVAGDLLDYSYRSTPRTQISGKVYTSTEYPAHQSIPLHNEMSYTRQWPMVLGFFCVLAPDEGGATPVADSRKVFKRIDPATRERFERKEVRYVRNYGADLDLSWQDVFQTNDPAAVEDYCREASIECEWRDAEHLRTSQLCQSVATHPETHEQVWFNQAHLFHVSSLDSELRNALLNSTGGELPRNAVHGDGSPISDDDLQEIRAAYEMEAVEFPWQQGDVLVVDNMLVAHGRRPYRGDRKIVVAMGKAYPEIISRG